VLQELVGDAWRPFEDEVRAGGRARRGFDRQVGWSAPRAELLGAMARPRRPRPGGAFLAAVQGGAAAPSSSAPAFAMIEEFWDRHGLPEVELVASELDGSGPSGGPPYRVAYSPRLGDCPRCGPGGCKAAVLRELHRADDVVWVFGDGASDLCPAREADLVFARGHLAELCTAASLPWRPLDFAAAGAALAVVAA
jgi:hypothetical protein